MLTKCLIFIIFVDPPPSFVFLLEGNVRKPTFQYFCFVCLFGFCVCVWVHFN